MVLPRAAGQIDAGSAAADFGDQVDFAVGVERREVGVLEDLAVDYQSDAFVDLMPQAGEAAVELEDQTADIVRIDLELGQPAGLTAGRSSRSRRCRGSAPAQHRQGS
jgi:hypothetical protein